MIRPACSILFAALLAATPVLAKPKPPADDEAPAAEKGGKGAKPRAGKKGAKAEPADQAAADPKGKKPGKGKPTPLGAYGDWNAFTAQTKGKTCYALAQPRDRMPASLKRDAAYVFISSRPGESVRNEVSIIMGFAMKDNSEAKAEIGGVTFELIAKGANAWVKDEKAQAEFIEAMKKGSKLVIKASSVKGNLNTDSYSLAGLSDALARVQKECP